MLGFELDVWDWITFAALLFIALGAVSFVVWLAGLPGRIAIARNHPDAQAVLLMGWAGFLAVVPWIQAFIWAFKPTDIVDIRRFPAEEKRAIEEEIASLRTSMLAGGSPPPPRAAPPDVGQGKPQG
jgi:hypothetical protein